MPGDSLKLTPGKVTGQRREMLATLVKAKIENYRQLSAGLRRGDASAIEHYAAAENRALKAARPPAK